MSVVDQLKNVFAKKTPEVDDDSRLSLGVPDPTLDSMMTEQMLGEAGHAAVTPGARPKSVEPVSFPRRKPGERMAGRVGKRKSPG